MTFPDPDSSAGRWPVAVMLPATDDAAQEVAAALAARLGLPCTAAADQAELLLAFTATAAGPARGQYAALELRPADGRCGAVRVDFDAPALRHRLQGGAELVARAVRGRSREPLQVVDATAGLGRDALVLAANGFAVTMIERSPIVAALLADGLARAQASEVAETAAIAARLALVCADATQWLAAVVAEARPDVVYLDPMFPDERKSALPRKEMQLFQQLLEHGPEDPQLLAAARRAARLRVVVKRPIKGPLLAGVAPSHQLSGKAVRFDVYLSLAGAGAD